MTSTLITRIGELTTNDPERGETLGLIHDAAMIVDGDHVAWVGKRTKAPPADERIDVGGRAVIPAFVDSHSHLVFAGDRAAEFTARMAGTPYDGGGIGETVAATRAATDDELRALVADRVRAARDLGTGVIEIKSGYGLDVDTEARSLRIAREFTDETTYLGAHVIPPGATDRSDYLALVTGDMLVACAPHATWIDVFCEPNSPHAFTGEEARAVLTAGTNFGLGVRVHGNQLGYGPGVALAVEFDAASVDHCTFLSGDDVAALAGSTTVATLLPGVEFSTRMPYPDGRRLIDAGVPVALASDCNPGTCNTASLPFVIALAVRECGMTAAEALYAATAGGALALRRGDVGWLGPGARADLTVLDAPSHEHLAYRPGMPLAQRLFT